ncbi:MFS general substrate transporter [Aspergillus heteromorphus CBS 117.55]|uniref:MFS general substrate transporter n=1 Tax=Aspergillus heteromorphus CBS 117.55 TaxID=1448321 RepID=A0A317WD16_9EURO|nr:MFS general substrate transporter [Aspergillus heteromorphus CBS 117.55]PWY82928.1 MFS general substrate transporter [Aspergillus heteromorphus CBS 117.55]
MSDTTLAPEAGFKSAITQLDDVEHSSADEKTKDPNIVDFDGPNDPENPMNWSATKKTMTIAIVSVMTMLSPIGSTISSAGAPDIMSHFHSTNASLESFITTVYLLGYTFGPIAIAPLSELYGRAPLYKICMVLFVIFNIACAVANTLPSLIVFRLLAGVWGSCPVTLGTGSIADMIPREKRAGAMAAYVLGSVLGPTIGPICGGYLTPAAGWRWNFWLLAILAGVVAVVVILFVHESYPYVLLQQKTRRLRKETGNPNLRSALDTGRTPRELFTFSIWRPLKMLLSPIVFALSLYAAVVYSYMYLCFTTFPLVFADQYGFGSGASGLATLGLALGSAVGVVICGVSVERLSAYLTKRNGGEPKPEYRLPTLAIGGVCVPIGLFWYGWTAESKTHWIVPIIGTGFVGSGMIVTYMASSMYLVDAYTVYAASVTASSTILRCLFGSLLPLAGNAMFSALGVGWGNSVLGFISVAFLPVPFFLYLLGEGHPSGASGFESDASMPIKTGSNYNIPYTEEFADSLDKDARALAGALGFQKTSQINDLFYTDPNTSNLLNQWVNDRQAVFGLVSTTRPAPVTVSRLFATTEVPLYGALFDAGSPPRIGGLVTAKNIVVLNMIWYIHRFLEAHPTLFPNSTVNPVSLRDNDLFLEPGESRQ